MTFQLRTPPVGSRAGTLAIPHDAPTPRLQVLDYGSDAWRETSIGDPEGLQPVLDSPETTWVDMYLRNTEQHVLQTWFYRKGGSGAGRRSN